MDIRKKIFYFVIRLFILIVVVCCVTEYYDDKCNIYKDKMFEAMEERDKALDQVSLLESELYKLKTQPSEFLYNMAEKELTQWK